MIPIMLFVCHPKEAKPNSKIDIEVFTKTGSISLLELSIDDAQRIATEMLIEVQRRKGE